MESRCSKCLEIKSLDDFYNYNKDKSCKKCEIERTCERLLCECGRYYTKTHYHRHLKTQLHKRGIGVVSQLVW